MVFVVVTTPVPVLSAVTPASGMIAPVESVTVPEMVARPPVPCPSNDPGENTIARAATIAKERSDRSPKKRFVTRLVIIRSPLDKD
jgi:hypothetical protein